MYKKLFGKLPIQVTLSILFLTVLTILCLIIIPEPTIHLLLILGIILSIFSILNHFL